MSDVRASAVVEHASSLSFDATVARLVQAMAERGLTIFAHIDHALNARQVGMSMPPATILIYGNPEGGTPVMLAAPLAALDLPLHVLIREREDGTAAIVFHPVAAMLQEAGVPENAAVRLEPAQQMLLAAVTA